MHVAFPEPAEGHLYTNGEPSRTAAIRGSIREFLAGLATGLGRALHRSDYTLGCAISAMAVESPTLSDPIRAAVGEFYGAWADAVAAGLRRHGMDTDRAGELGGPVITCLVGALAVAKARRDTAPFRQVETVLGALAGDPLAAGG